MDKKDVGNRIKELRLALNLTQREFSKKAKLAQSAISQFEEGVRMPTMKALEALCKTYDVGIEYFLVGAKSMDDEGKAALISRMTKRFEEMSKEDLLAMDRMVERFVDRD